MKPFLEMRQISKTFVSVKALRGVDLTVFPGEVHAVAGENGAGKSTLMKIMTGVLRADPGGRFKSTARLWTLPIRSMPVRSASALSIRNFRWSRT